MENRNLTDYVFAKIEEIKSDFHDLEILMKVWVRDSGPPRELNTPVEERKYVNDLPPRTVAPGGLPVPRGATLEECKVAVSSTVDETTVVHKMTGLELVKLAEYMVKNVDKCKWVEDVKDIIGMMEEESRK